MAWCGCVVTHVTMIVGQKKVALDGTMQRSFRISWKWNPSKEGPTRSAAGRARNTSRFLHVRHRLTDAFVEAAKNAGYAFNEDYNGERQAGIAYGQVSQKRGLRASSATSFLDPARKRRNLHVATRATVRRILFEKSRAVAVEYERHGSIHVARCEREILLTAGAIATPRLLQLSGVGPADVLRKAGIEVQVDLPGVGANLQDHLGIAMFFEANVKTMNREFTPWDIARGGLDLLVRGRGTATAAFAHAILFGSVEGNGVDYKAIFAPYGLTASEHSSGGLNREKLMDTNAVTVRPTVLHPRARGTVVVSSADPHLPPLIRHRYASDDRDVLALVSICRSVREIVGNDPMARYIVRELLPGTTVTRDSDWEHFVRERAYPGKHVGGTCKMGVDKASVVDPRLNVYGVEGLRVMDMSITPTLPTGNTNASAMMIGARGADLVCEEVT